jgi:hypothetical protein
MTTRNVFLSSAISKDPKEKSKGKGRNFIFLSGAMQNIAAVFASSDFPGHLRTSLYFSRLSRTFI